MAERLAFLYEKNRPGLVTRLAEAFARLGMRVVRPGGDAVGIIDDEGETHAASPNALERSVDAGDTVRFQWWIDSESDVYCRIRAALNIQVVELGLEGSTSRVLSAIGGALKRRLVASGDDGIGLVFDPEGYAEDYEWDDFLLSASSTLDGSRFGLRFPHTVAVRTNSEARIQNTSERVARTRMGGFTFFSATDPSDPVRRLRGLDEIKTTYSDLPPHLLSDWNGHSIDDVVSALVFVVAPWNPDTLEALHRITGELGRLDRPPRLLLCDLDCLSDGSLARLGEVRGGEAFWIEKGRVLASLKDSSRSGWREAMRANCTLLT